MFYDHARTVYVRSPSSRQRRRCLQQGLLVGTVTRQIAKGLNACFRAGVMGDTCLIKTITPAFNQLLFPSSRPASGLVELAADLDHRRSRGIGVGQSLGRQQYQHAIDSRICKYDFSGGTIAIGIGITENINRIRMGTSAWAAPYSSWPTVSLPSCASGTAKSEARSAAITPGTTTIGDNSQSRPVDTGSCRKQAGCGKQLIDRFYPHRPRPMNGGVEYMIRPHQRTGMGHPRPGRELV